MSLVSLADMKTYLGETSADYDTFLQEQLDLYSSAVENYCGRKFLAADYTQTYYIDDYNEALEELLLLYQYPVNTITSVKEITSSEGVDTETTTLETYEYRLNSTKGFLKKFSNGLKVSWFYGLTRPSRIEVVYNAGFATTPLEIDSVVKSLVEEQYNKKVSGVALSFGNDVQRVAIPGTISIDFDYTLQANERKVKFGMLLGNYVNVLDYFRSERAVVGEVRDNYVG